MALLFTPSGSALSGVQNSSRLADDEKRRREEEERRKAREAAAAKSKAAVTSAKQSREYQQGIEAASKSGVKGLPPRNIFDTSGDVASAEREANEDQAVLSTLGGSSADFTPNAKKLMDLNKNYEGIQKKIKEVETFASPDYPKTTFERLQKVGRAVPAPDPAYLQKQRDELISQLYAVEKQFHDMSGTLGEEDYASIRRAEELYKSVYDVNKKSKDAETAKLKKIPGALATQEALTAPVVAGLSFGGLLPGILSRIEAVKKGRATLPSAIVSVGEEQKIINRARADATAPETFAGKTSSLLSNFAKFGLEVYATAGVLSQVPVVAPLINASKAAQITGGTVRVAPTITQGAARGAVVFGARELGVQGALGEGVKPEQVLIAAAEGAIFEGFVAPALGRVWRKITTDRVGEATFMFRPGEGTLPNAKMLPGKTGTSWMPKQVKEVFMRTSLDAKGVQRRMTFSMEDGNIYEMKWVPQGDGNIALQVTKDAPNWLKKGAMDLLGKFNGAETPEKPIDTRRSYSPGSNGEPQVMKPGKTASRPMVDDEFFYHTTSAKNQESIAKSGLITSDGKIHLAELPETARILGEHFNKGAESNNLLLRVSKKGIAQIWGDPKTPSMSWYTNAAIDPKHVQANINGEWIPVTMLKEMIQKGSAPTIVGIPDTPMPEHGKEFMTMGMMNVRKFLGGEYFNTYAPKFGDVTGKESRLAQYRQDVPPPSGSSYESRKIIDDELRKNRLVKPDIETMKIQGNYALPEEKKVASAAYDFAIENKEALFEKYDGKKNGAPQEVIFMAGGTGAGKTNSSEQLLEDHVYIGADEFKFDIAEAIAPQFGMTPEKFLTTHTEAIHELSSELAKELFWRRVSERKSVLYDSNLTGSSADRVQKIIKAGIPVRLEFIYRDPYEAWFQGVIPRQEKTGRPINLDTHARTHTESPLEFLKLYEKFKGDPMVRFEILESTAGGNYVTKDIDFLRDKLYSADDVHQGITAGQTSRSSDKAPDGSNAGGAAPANSAEVRKQASQKAEERTTVTEFGQFKDDPELAPVHEELVKSSKFLEEVVTGAERQIAEVYVPSPQEKALVDLAKQIKELIPPQQRRLPGGMTRNEFLNDLATSGDSISAITDRLKVIAEQTQNPRLSRDITEFVNRSTATGKFDDLGDFTAFQNAITEKGKAAKPDLITRADAIVQQLGDFEIAPGKKVSDLLNEIDMLEFQLHDQIDARRKVEPQRKAKKQDALVIDAGTNSLQRQPRSRQRETIVKGRDLLKAISGLSRDKERSFRIRLRDAVRAAQQAKKDKLMDQYAARRDEIAEIKGELVDEVRKMVPPERRGKFLAAVKNVETRRQLEKALDRVDKEVAAIERKQAIDNLKDISKVKLSELRPEYRGPIKELIDSVDPVKRTSKTMSSLQSLVDYLKREPENQVPESRLAELGLLSKKKIEDLTTEEINQLHDSIAHLVHLNTIKNKLLIRGKLREYGKIREEAIQNVLTNHEAKNGSITGLDSMQIEKEPGAIGKIFTVDSYNAELKSEILDGKDAGVIRQVLYDGIDEGVTRQLRFEHTAEDFFKDRLQGIDMTRWSYVFQKKAANVDRVSVQISGKRTLTMTKGERVAFLLHNMNPNNRKHLLEGGFSFPNTPSKISALNEADMNAIESSATEEEFTVAGAINEYLNTIQKDEINRVAVDLNGHEIAREKDYFPIRTSFLDRFHDDLIKSKNYSQKTLEGMGIFKERQSAGNALIVEDAFVALYKSMKQVGAYVGLAQPLRSAKMLLNDNELQIAARTVGKNHYITSLRSYLERIEGDAVNIENVDKLTFDLINKLDVAALGLNPFVMVKQPVSYLNAATEMEWRFLARSAKTMPTVQDLADMRKYSPQIRDRMDGRVTREAGEIAEVGGPMKFFTGQTLFSQKFTSGLERFDRIAIGRIWNAAKMETAEKFPELKGDEFFGKVAERTEMVIRRTQSTSHVKDRSTIGMTKNVFVRMLTRFSSERNKAYMQMRRAAERYNRSEKTAKDKANFFNAVFVVAIATPLIIIGIDAARDKLYGKEEKRTIVSTFWDVVGNALGTIYFVGTAFEPLRSKIEKGTFAGYDVDTSLTQFINQTLDTMANTARLMGQVVTQEKYKSGVNSGEKKWKVTAEKLVFEMMTTIAQLKGVPTAPIRILKAGVDWATPDKKKSSSSTRQGGSDRAGSMQRASTKRVTTQR